jgi:hypothetical protein
MLQRPRPNITDLEGRLCGHGRVRISLNRLFGSHTLRSNLCTGLGGLLLLLLLVVGTMAVTSRSRCTPGAQVGVGPGSANRPLPSWRAAVQRPLTRGHWHHDCDWPRRDIGRGTLTVWHGAGCTQDRVLTAAAVPVAAWMTRTTPPRGQLRRGISGLGARTVPVALRLRTMSASGFNECALVPGR